METASIFLVLIVGIIKFIAVMIIVMSAHKWRVHKGFPYKEQALVTQWFFTLIAIHIVFRLLCLFWQPIFGSFLLITDLSSTPLAVLMAYAIKKAVDKADRIP